MKHFVFVIVSATLAACTSTTSSPVPSGGNADLPPQDRVAAEGNPVVGVDSGDGGAASTEAAAYVLPSWKLEDVQPKSARFGAVYGLEQFKGKTLVVVLLEGFCSFCQSNSLVAQELQNSLSSENQDVQIVVLADGNASEFASRVTLPIFRDSDKSAWRAMRAGATKHDTFVFGPNGLRTYFWPGSYQGDAGRWKVDVGQAVRAVAKPKS